MKNGPKRDCLWQGSNLRPSACEADVITTTLQRPAEQQGKNHNISRRYVLSAKHRYAMRARIAQFKLRLALVFLYSVRQNNNNNKSKQKQAILLWSLLSKQLIHSLTAVIRSAIQSFCHLFIHVHSFHGSFLCFKKRNGYVERMNVNHE